MQKKSFLPPHIVAFGKRVGITLILMSITRILFLGFNYDSFSDISITDFLAGIWFDLIAIALWFLPFFLWSTFPLPIRGYTWHRLIQKILFHLTNAGMLAFNLMDIEYFKFTSKRSTSDLFTVLGAGEDFSQLVGSFFADSWHLILILICLIIVANWMYNKSVCEEKNTFKTVEKSFWVKSIVTFVIATGLMILVGRGGFGLKPAGVLTASNYTKIENTALVLNTPLTIVKSLNNTALKEKEYFSPEELSNISTPIHTANLGGEFNDSTNVVIIMLESFGNEWVGDKNHKTFTPFLDSLISESLYFPKGISNGKKSIEAVPSILASIPSLSDNPYISSNYNNNTIQSLAATLNKHGYNSTFYHGATNGSMHFDEFSALAGFDSYKGRFEYDNDEHSDGTWGILDEYFNPWSANQMALQQEPFMATLFTLSSHHPYFVPEQYRNTLPKGSVPMAQSIAYGDMSLRLFFEEAKKHEYYENTIFVIVADHTPAGKEKEFLSRIGMYRIPILFYSPSGKIKPKKSKKVFGQIDIYPTLLDMLNIKDSVYSFGESYYKAQKGGTFVYIEGTYQYFEGDYMLTFANDKAQNLYNFELDPLMKKDSIKFLPEIKKDLERKIKAVIQNYNHDMMTNHMIIK